MDLLQVLAGLGLPGWLMSVAALVIILHYTGIIKWVQDSLKDEQEAWQEERQHELHSKAQTTATQELRRERFENVALEIARENIDWARKDFSLMQKSVEALARSVDSLKGSIDQLDKNQARIFEFTRDEIRILAGAIGRLADKLEKDDG